MSLSDFKLVYNLQRRHAYVLCIHINHTHEDVESSNGSADGVGTTCMSLGDIMSCYAMCYYPWPKL